MIKAAYHYKNSPLRSVEFETNADGLILLDGNGAQDFFDLLALKGEDSLDGSCFVNDEDLLDLNNANRDRLPVSVLTSSNYSFTVIHTQVPFGGSVDTSQIDEVTKRYIEKEKLPSSWSLNLINLFDAIYSELCAKPKYLLLHLGNADKDFAKAVVGLSYKALRNYPIIIYAHCLTEEIHEEIVLREDIEEILHPKEEPTFFDEEKAEKNLIQTAFLNDLLGTGRLNFDPDGDQWDDSFFGEEENPRRSRWKMIAGIFLELLSYAPPLAFFFMKKTDFILFFGSMLVYIVLTTASGYFGTRLYKEKRKKKFWRNKHLAAYCFTAIGLLGASIITMIVLGLLGGFSSILYAYIVAFAVMALHGFVMLFYYWFEHKIFFRGERRGAQDK